jgi:antirestriction protein ArdC
MATQNEIREQITQKIVDALKAGTAPWRRPWSNLINTGSPANIVSKKSYTGVNPLILELVCLERGYQSRWWGTFRQWTSLGFRVKPRPATVQRGHYGTKIVFCKPMTKLVDRKHADADDSEERKTRFFMLKEFCVFNAEQCEGDGIEKVLAQPRTTKEFVDFTPFEAVIAATEADIRHAGNRAYYQPAGDFIQMPEKQAFESQVAYYSTLAHEGCHWTGNENRLNRLNKNARFGDAAYAFEELVAEIGGCFLCNEVGVPQSEDLSNHQAYLGHWLSILKADPSAIFSAASQASAAVDFILAFSRKEVDDETGEENEAEPVGAGGLA